MADRRRFNRGFVFCGLRIRGRNSGLRGGGLTAEGTEHLRRPLKKMVSEVRCVWNASYDNDRHPRIDIFSSSVWCCKEAEGDVGEGGCAIASDTENQEDERRGTGWIYANPLGSITNANRPSTHRHNQDRRPPLTTRSGRCRITNWNRLTASWTCCLLRQDF